MLFGAWGELATFAGIFAEFDEARYKPFDVDDRCNLGEGTGLGIGTCVRYWSVADWTGDVFLKNIWWI